MKKTNYTLTIGWLYPELMSTYGDRGNIIVLQKRCEWRGIKATVLNLDVGFDASELEKCDLLFMGGAQDAQQAIVSKDLKEKSFALQKKIEEGTPTLLICGAYQFLGKYYKEADGTIIKGLDILDFYTKNPGPDYPRLIGNISVEFTNADRTHADKFTMTTSTLVGFENHGGRTHLGKNIQPLGKVISGYGNNGENGTEGAEYKNTFGTYMHGPILPKNPEFADLLISLALEKKYGLIGGLKKLDDSLELKAKERALEKV